jgi:ATP-dependent Lon protease
MSESLLNDHLISGFKTSESGLLLIDLSTHDQLASEKKINEKLELAASDLALKKACDEFEHVANTIGYDYSQYEVGEELKPVEAPTRKKIDGISGIDFDCTYVKIFDMDAVEKRLQFDLSSSGDRDERRSREKRLKKIADSRSYRKLARVQADTDARLDGLEEDLPNFFEVIQYLRGVVAIAHADDRTPQPQHLLLNGPPGIGKTLFATCIAKIFDTKLHIAHLETMQTSADLVGTSSSYSNATTGLIFNALIEGEYANPIVLLDEIDKASGDHRRPTTSALYNLLEDTSAFFHDESEQWLELDASRIIYIATANDVDAIDPAILSRLRVFDIEAPSRNQSYQIIENIFAGIQRSRPRAFSNLRLNGSAIEKLLDLSPRKIKAALTTAAGNALIAGRTHICGLDVEVEQRKQKSIGFVS